jgi:hypothetical protein
MVLQHVHASLMHPIKSILIHVVLNVLRVHASVVSCAELTDKRLFVCVHAGAP